MTNKQTDNKYEHAVFGGGCFWCLDAAFSHVRGVRSVVAGYAGGIKDNPSYEEVCAGDTGHAEVVRIEFDPHIISYDELLRLFFSLHDPTTPDRQGNDIGRQYRSIILFKDQQQRGAAETLIKRLKTDKVYPRPVVTELKPLEKFYPAEEYHQEYFKKNPDKAYCRLVIVPKMADLRRKYGEYYI